MHRAGAETLLMQIYRNINREKIQFDFLVHSDQPGHYDDEIRSLGGKIIHIPVLPGKNYFQYTRRLKMILLENGPYWCIHSHLLLLSGIVLGVAKSVNIPCRIAHSHTNADVKGDVWFREPYAWYMRYLIKRHATNMLAVSRPAGEWLFGRNCWTDPRVQVIHNAIDLNPYENLTEDRMTLRKKLGISNEGLLITHIGRFIKQKNHRKVLEVFVSILKLHPSSRLMLIGEGSFEDEIASLIDILGIKNHVYQLGVRSDIPELLGASDIFLFPSLFEGLGIVLIEAQAAGVPCVVSDTIPTEADLGMGLIKFLPLSASSDIWARKALSMYDPVRIPWSTRERYIKKNEYDMAYLIPILEKLYSCEINSTNE